MNIIDPALALILLAWQGLKPAFIPLIASLAGACVGATAAFRFERKAKLDDEKKIHLNEIDFIIFQLARNYEILINYRDQFINPHRNEKGRFISIQPTIFGSNFSDKIDYRNIMFLFKTNNPNCPMEISNLNEKFHLCISAATYRNHLHYNRLQNLFSEKNIPQGTDILIKDIVNIIGVPLAEELTNITDDLINGVDDAILDTIKVKNSIRDAVKYHYVDAKLADIVDNAQTPIQPERSETGS